MSKYNIYKIDKEKEEELIEKLKSVNLELSKIITVDNYKLSFYFSNEPDNISIWWTSVYSEFLEEDNIPFNKVYFATLIISNNECCYAISLGKSHFYLRNFCDPDFGLDLAERIVDKNNLKIKNSRYFASKKSKVIASYIDNSEIDVDSGESMQYIKAATIDSDTWGQTVNFGTSVSFNLKITPLELPKFIEKINLTLDEEAKFSLPREQKIKDKDIIEKLDKELVQAILNENNTAAVQNQQMNVCGVEFIFSDNFKYEIYLKGERKKFAIDGDITISKLKEFIEKKKINLYDDINNIKVKVYNETNKGYTKKIKYFLDYVDNDRYCLLNGDWYKFNQSYIEYIYEEVNSIEVNIDKENNFYKHLYEKYLTDNGYSKNVMYGEKYFNISMEDKGYINMDRDLSGVSVGNFKVEKADLYKNNTLYFVKIGKPQKLGYVIDQSMATLNLLKNNEIEKDKRIDTLCLWIILDRAKAIDNISEINSIIFLMKLVEWKKEVINAGYKCMIKLGYCLP